MIPGSDFLYKLRDGKAKELWIGGWKRLRNALATLAVVGAIGTIGVRRAGGLENTIGIGKEILQRAMEDGARLLKR